MWRYKMIFLQVYWSQCNVFIARVLLHKKCWNTTSFEDISLFLAKLCNSTYHIYEDCQIKRKIYWSRHYDDVIHRNIISFLMKLYVKQTHGLTILELKDLEILLEHNVLKAEDDRKVLWYYVIILRSLHYKMEMGLIPFLQKKLNFPQKKR